MFDISKPRSSLGHHLATVQERSVLVATVRKLDGQRGQNIDC